MQACTWEAANDCLAGPDSMRQSGLLKADAKLYTHAALTDADMDQILGAVKKAAQCL